MQFYLSRSDNNDIKTRYDVNGRVIVEVRDIRDNNVTMIPAVDVQPYHHLIIDGYEYTIDALDTDKRGM